MKNPTFREVSRKTYMEGGGGLPKKRELGQFAGLMHTLYMYIYIYILPSSKMFKIQIKRMATLETI